MAELKMVEGTDAWLVNDGPGDYELPMAGAGGGAWPAWNRIWTKGGFGSGVTATLMESPGQYAPGQDEWQVLFALVNEQAMSFESKAVKYMLRVEGGTPNFLLWVR